MKDFIQIILFAVLPFMGISVVAQSQPCTYAVASTPWDEGLGNHRAVVEVKQTAKAVMLHLDWRRGDKVTDQHCFLVVNAQNGDTIANVLKLQISPESCDMVFGPVMAAGTYYIYYLPYEVVPSGGYYYGNYLKDTPPDSTWVSSLTRLGALPSAEVKRLESRTSFDSFYPMEVIATENEVKAYTRRHLQSWYAFPEDRTRPIRMRAHLPYRWMQCEPGDTLKGIAAPNEYYAFQIGIWCPTSELKHLGYTASALENSEGGTQLSKNDITCFNTEGINPDGIPFHNTVNVPANQVQPLWFGIDIPENAAPGTYNGTITLSADGQPDLHVPLAITIDGKPIAERGDQEPWRHSRLRWLNSTLGIADTPIAPYTKITENNGRPTCLGRTMQLDAQTPLPGQINSWGTDLLASPLRFVVETSAGEKLLVANPEKTQLTDGHCTWTWEAEDQDLTVGCTGRMEFDGWMQFSYTLHPKHDFQAKDIRLELPLHKEVATYILGAGLPGQETPKVYDGGWDTPVREVNEQNISVPVNRKSNWLWPFDSFWLGNAKAGIHCELRGASYTGPLLNAYHPAYPESWYNHGRGGFRLRQEGDVTHMTVYSGERTLKVRDSINFSFALIVTPVKELNLKSQFNDRYYHNGAKPTPTDADVEAGVRIINVHHANEYNPYINYPFLSEQKLVPFVEKWHHKGCKVKLYYTLRELSNVCTELWAIRSLGHEVLRGGNGGGYPWLREHLVDDYSPQWYHHFGSDDMVTPADAAILTTESDSRWYNYYIEGLRYMVSHYDIDGLYMDDVSFGRDILKRMRRAMDMVKPDCIIDLHSNTGFSRGPANQYAEFFPYVDKLWFGESFQYDRMSPANWLVESSGIPFGLMGDMLQGGGNRWLGMQYGMTVRHPWVTENVVCDPRPIWKEWDRFGIDRAHMYGFWETQVPVITDDSSVKVTTYQRGRKLMLSVGNYSDTTKQVSLRIDWQRLGLRPHTVHFTIPAIDGFQPALPLTRGQLLTVEPRKGYLIYAE